MTIQQLLEAENYTTTSLAREHKTPRNHALLPDMRNRVGSSGAFRPTVQS